MICAVLFSRTIEGLRTQLQMALDSKVEIIEFRLDGLKDLKPSLIKELMNQNPLPSILSLRSEWKGTLIQPPSNGRRNILSVLIDLNPEYIDLEFPNDLPLLQNVKNDTTVILSLIDFEGMAKISLESALEITRKHQNVIIKISATPISVAELKQLWSWANNLHKNNVRHVIVGMGQLGSITRIKSIELTNLWMYGKITPEIGEPFVPGMMPISTLNQAYADDSWHLATISKTSSQDIQNLFQRILQVSNLKGVHIDLPIQNYPELAQLLLWVQDGLLDGLLIQELWQTEIINKLTILDASVVHVRKCNAVKIVKEGLKGYNTNVEAIRRCLNPYSDKNLQRIYIEGTNELARAAISALKEKAQIIVVRGRIESELEQLKLDFPEITFYEDWFSNDFDLIVNCETTDVGFENVLTLPKPIFDSSRVVFNASSELNSYLEKISIEHKKYYIDNNLLVLNSAVYAFELWTNRSVPITNLASPDKIGTGINV